MDDFHFMLYSLELGPDQLQNLFLSPAAAA